VRYKEKANFCSYFVPRPKFERAVSAPKEEKPEPANSISRKLRHKQRKQARGKQDLKHADKEKRKAAWDSLFKD
jgi:hypothetical protein